MKKTLAIILALCLGASMLAACGGSGSSAPASASVGGSTGSSAPEAKPVEIRVVTSYGGDDGNRPIMKKRWRVTKRPRATLW